MHVRWLSGTESEQTFLTPKKREGQVTVIESLSVCVSENLKLHNSTFSCRKISARAVDGGAVCVYVNRALIQINL